MYAYRVSSLREIQLNVLKHVYSQKKKKKNLNVCKICATQFVEEEEGVSFTTGHMNAPFLPSGIEFSPNYHINIADVEMDSHVYCIFGTRDEGVIQTNPIYCSTQNIVATTERLLKGFTFFFF